MINTKTIDGNAELLSPQETVEHQAALEISRAWAEAKSVVDTAIRRVVVCGLLLMRTKAEVKHGQFGPWLEKNCPEIPWRTAQQWMATSQSVCDALQIRNDCAFADLPLYQVLSLPAPELPDEAKAVQEKVFQFVDGKSQKQLLFEFKDIDPKKKAFNPSKLGPKEAADAEQYTAIEETKLLIIAMRQFRKGNTLALIPDDLFYELESEKIDLHVFLSSAKRKGKGRA